MKSWFKHNKRIFFWLLALIAIATPSFFFFFNLASAPYSHSRSETSESASTRAETVAHTAGIGHNEPDLADFENSMDLLAFVESLAPRVEQGDVGSLRLSRMAEELCGSLEHQLQPLLNASSGQTALARSDLEQAFISAEVEQYGLGTTNFDAAVMLFDRCQNLIQRAPNRLFSKSFHDAVSDFFNGEPTVDTKIVDAEMLLDDADSLEGEQKILPLIREVLSAGEPGLVGNFFSNWRLSPGSMESMIEQLAWNFADCDLGNPGCLPASNSMLRRCITSSWSCDSSTDYRAWSAGFYSADVLNHAELRAREIVTRLREGQLDELIESHGRCSLVAAYGLPNCQF